MELPLDGAPVPPWKSWLSMVPALGLGYLDLGTDIFTAVSYLQDDHYLMFWLILLFVLGSALIAGLFFLRNEDWSRRVLVVLHLGLVWEALVSFNDKNYSHLLVTLRVVGPLYESVPQLMLQLYAMLVVGNDTSGISFIRFVSIAISALSLAYVTTGLLAERPLSELKEKLQSGVEEAEGGGDWLTGIMFGTVPALGRVSLGAIDMHPQHFVWMFLLYEVFEIVSRFFSLALLALVLQEWFILVLLYLWLSRMLILKVSGELHVQTQLRLVGVPFMDSVLDSAYTFIVAVLITLVEFVSCILISNIVFNREDVNLPHESHQVISTVAIVCMVGKLVIAFLIVVPFKSLVWNSQSGRSISPLQLDEPIATGGHSVQRVRYFLEDAVSDSDDEEEIDVDDYNEDRIDIGPEEW
ncbi:unnamed protein product [Choristocarpus tenellus]